MINKIKILPEHIVNKIAAGEVVERPASVIKELVENALDAGAKRIEIIIREGGKDNIQVVDDGAGMTETDLLLAFERHATSKIISMEDLQRIDSLGFRGEALASIAAVSRIEVTSAAGSGGEGTRVKIEGGIVRSVGKTGRTQGTTVVVKNLFYNVPARRKFLRSTTSEFRHIYRMVKKFALAFPRVSFRLIHNDGETMRLEKGDLKTRMRDLFGPREWDRLIGFEERSGAVGLRGYLGKLDLLRKSRGEQYLFLNNRPIIDRRLNHAVFSAYGRALDPGCFPFFVLFLKIPPDQVDVNIHPTKREVKFRDEYGIYQLVRSAAKKALASDESLFSSLEAKVEQPRPIPGMGPQPVTPIMAFPGVPEGEEVNKGTGGPSGEEKRGEVGTVSIWQLHQRYIVSQIKSGLAIIDQHAAHERILFERAMRSFHRERLPSQQLLFPQQVELSAEDLLVLKEIGDYLEKVGFVIREFGPRTVAIEAVPAILKAVDGARVLKDVLDEYRENKLEHMEKLENIAHSFACHAAIRAGDKLNPEEMQALVDQLFACQFPFTCPHGRPTVINLSLNELDKRFKRT